MDRKRLSAQLVIDEDKRRLPYRCSAGKLTIGVGRNLDDRGLSEDEIAYLLNNDIDLVEKELDRRLPWWREMTEARQTALANMAFNLGVPRLLGFVKTLDHMRARRYDAAAREMLDSTWAKQVGARARRLADLMRKGEF